MATTRMAGGWEWKRAPGLTGHSSHSRGLRYAGDATPPGAETTTGKPLYLPAGHTWEVISSPNRGGASYGIWVTAREVCHKRATLLWAHLQDELVRARRRYAGGTLLGHADNTGASSGPHLHFETDKDFWYWAARIFTPGEEENELAHLSEKAQKFYEEQFQIMQRLDPKTNAGWANFLINGFRSIGLEGLQFWGKVYRRLQQLDPPTNEGWANVLIEKHRAEDDED